MQLLPKGFALYFLSWSPVHSGMNGRLACCTYRLIHRPSGTVASTYTDPSRAEPDANSANRAPASPAWRSTHPGDSSTQSSRSGDSSDPTKKKPHCLWESLVRQSDDESCTVLVAWWHVSGKRNGQGYVPSEDVGMSRMSHPWHVMRV